MRNPTLRILVFLCLYAPMLPTVEFLGVNYDQEDKQGHFVMGATASGLAIIAWNEVRPEAAWYEKAAVGIGAAIVVGALKEWTDGQDPLHHTQDRYDFIATATGGVPIAFTLCWKF